jgi:hypothetical protein
MILEVSQDRIISIEQGMIKGAIEALGFKYESLMNILNRTKCKWPYDPRSQELEFSTTT